MFGTTDKGKPYYKCVAKRPGYAAASVPDHPPTYSVREERITARLDEWLEVLISPEHVDATVEAILAADAETDAEPDHVRSARRRAIQLGIELDRMLAAVRAGMDPVLAAAETRKIQAELAGASSAIKAWEASGNRTAPLTEADIRRALSGAGDLVRVLRGADRADRTALYRALRVHLSYKREAPAGLERVHARLELTRSGGRI